MPEISIRIAHDDASPAMRRLAGYVERQEFKPAIGESVLATIQAHLFAYDQAHPNKMGGDRTNVVAAAAKASRWHRMPGGVRVTIPSAAVSGRYFGATIRPVNAKFLAIPARPEAYGRAPREFQLKAVFPRGQPVGRGIGWLVALDDYERRMKRGKRKGQLATEKNASKATHGEGGVMFWLVKKAVLKPTPELLPTDAEISQAAVDGVERGLAEKMMESGDAN
jgi:hypothetical protein